MSEETRVVPEGLSRGGRDFDPVTFLRLFDGLTQQAVTNYVEREVTSKGGLLDQMQEGIEYRNILLDKVHKHWEKSRISNEAFDVLMGNQDTRELGFKLSSMYYGYRRNSVDESVLPWHEKMRLVHLVLANVYGVSFEEQQVLTPEIGESWVHMLGSTEDIINDPEHQAKAHLEVDVLEAYLNQYQDFNKRYFTGVFGKPYGFEEASMKEKMVTTQTPGTAKRQAFFVLLHVLYGLDPRVRERLLKPSDDPEIQSMQRELLVMESLLVDEIVAQEVASRFRKVKLSDYLD